MCRDQIRRPTTQPKPMWLSLTEALASEASGQGVRIAAVLPGPVDTTFHKDMGAEASFYRLLLPSLTPERVARSAYFGLYARAARHRARNFQQRHVRCIKTSSTRPNGADRLLVTEAEPKGVNTRQNENTLDVCFMETNFGLSTQGLRKKVLRIRSSRRGRAQRALRAR